MSQENVERLRQAYEAFSRGDFDEALTFAHPDIEFFPPGVVAPFRGIERFRAWMEPDAFDRQVIEPLEFIDSGNKVLVEQLVKSRGASSGIELEGRSWSVWTVNEDGLATRVEGFMEGDEAQARKAAGLSETAISQENVELVRKAFAAINRTDLEGILSLTDSKVEFHSLIAESEGTTYRGHDGVREWWEQVKGSLGGLRFEPEAIRSEGDWAVVKVLVTGRIEGVAVQQRMWLATRKRNGKAVWWGIYRTETEALEAAGLSE